MKKDEAARWGALLASYEVVQPFPQLGREVIVLDDAELRESESHRFDGIAIPTARLFALTHRGWSHLHNAFAFRATPDIVVTFGVEPGFDAHPTPQEQRITWLQAADTRNARVAFREIPDIICSEIFRDLVLLR